MTQSDGPRIRRAFRAAFDYLQRQVERMPAYASGEKYWRQAADGLNALGCAADDPLLHDLLLAAYAELERIWLRERAGDADDPG